MRIKLKCHFEFVLSPPCPSGKSWYDIMLQFSGANKYTIIIQNLADVVSTIELDATSR